MARYNVSILLFAAWLVFAMPSWAASPQETYEEAKDTYTAAWVSLAAYDDRLSNVAKDALTKRGWAVDAKVARSDQAKARYISAKKDDTTILAIAGTATWGDVKADLNIHTIPFHGEEGGDGMKTHSGFTQYSDALLQAPTPQGTTVGQSLAATETKEKFILTGHSLGGAVAMLTAARLVDTGAAAVDVITFGAPAVGNDAFTETYDDAVHARHIVLTGDPVPTLLPAISSSYVTLRQLVWQTPAESKRFAHEMVAYVDSSLRRYYDAKRAYEAVLGHAVPLDTTPLRQTALYVLPVQIHVDADLTSDTPYIRDALDDALRQDATGLTWGPTVKRITEACAQARRAGQPLILERIVTGTRVKDQPYVFQLTLTQNIYSSLDGHLVDSRKSVTDTEQMTPIEAVLYMAFTNPLFATTWQ